MASSIPIDCPIFWREARISPAIKASLCPKGITLTLEIIFFDILAQKLSKSPLNAQPNRNSVTQMDEVNNDWYGFEDKWASK